MSDLKAAIRGRYGREAQRAARGERAGCGCDGDNPVTTDLYTEQEAGSLPVAARLASLGCGNPTALAELHPGEVVLDLGSGGGIDVLLAARRVGPSGRAYGLDMTAEMLELARANQRAAGVENAEFLEGDLERIPLPDASVDVIISNCVIDLAADKARAFAEAFRVLRPGGRFAVTDIVWLRPPPAEARRSIELWIGCIGGALEAEEYEARLAAAGFVDVSIEPVRVYTPEDIRRLARDEAIDVSALEHGVASAFVRARKPA
ncbi:MAG TPA: arsenite methyltransferase [Vicinamibacterales bacterium]|nr:arsenite methyltransferase [Vicinamibacterales bacterium]